MAFSIASCGGETPTETEPQPCDVIIISGQSNAVGCTHTNCISRTMGYSKYQEYMAGYEGIQIAYDCWTKDYEKDPPLFYSQNKSKDNGFVKVMLGQGNSLATFGPEIGIAEKLHEKCAGKLFLIKYACGASNLKDDWAQRGSPMYGQFIKYVNLQMENLKSMGYIPTIKAFCWMQGEGDAYPGYYNEYYDNLKGFVTNVREDLKAHSETEIPFIDAAISGTIDPSTSKPVWEFYRQVNEAKKQFADEGQNNYYIDTIEAGMHTDQEPFDTIDRCHYDSESEVLLGNLFAEKFEPFLMK